jgi:isochorismate pyruvate lyase
MSIKSPITSAADCTTMIEVRSGVDAIDKKLVSLLADRFAYMDAAARIKETKDEVRNEPRKAEVLANVRREALALRIPQDIVAEIWECLIEGSIAYEADRWDSMRGAD